MLACQSHTSHWLFIAGALAKKQIKDDIVDEHLLLLYIKYSAERPKRTRRGDDIPGTFLGAVSLYANSLLH